MHTIYLRFFRPGCRQERSWRSEDIIGRSEDTEDTGYVTIAIPFIV